MYVLLLALLTPRAHATGSCGATVVDDLTCSSSVTGQITSSTTSELGGTTTGTYYTCGSPYAPLAQTSGDQTYSFTCQATGDVTLLVTGMDCDLDMYVLGDTCDPYADCEDGSTQARTTDDTLTFACVSGQTYYVVIEGYGYSSGGAGRCHAGEGHYTLSFDVSAGTGCPEDCDDGVDNDFDSDIDCDDSDCAGDPVCSCDADLDGYDETGCGGTDCDDGDAAVHPGAVEICNGIDDDCDSSVDEGLSSTWYADDDGDRYGDATTTTSACSAPSGYVSSSTDCDDASSSIHPGAAERCNGVDDDCDGSVDEGLSSTWYADDDGDGYGDASATVSACSAPSGYVADHTDCDDSDANVHPGATERCNSADDDCDGSVDEGVSSSYWYADADGDGYGDAAVSDYTCSPSSGYVDNADDCDDGDASANPAGTEVPYDGLDQDCDGADLTDVDGDGDDAVAAGGTDCADGDAAVYTGATESADGNDNDCDGIVDEGTAWYDDDGDGYTEDGGDCDDTAVATSPAGIETADGTDQDCDGVVDEGTSVYDDDGDGYSEDAGDCNDGDRGVNPGVVEVADNGVDDDCDGGVDSGASDSDGDGYSPTGGDCDPGDASTYPGAPEVADGADNDCDGVIDEGTRAYDDDGDGVTEQGGDCDDGDPTTSGGAAEVSDGVDNDCDGAVDEGTDAYDDDGDGYTEGAGDCDDADATTHPGGEVEDGEDNDCDGLVDDGVSDADQDGVTTAEGDCDDTDGWAYPGLDEMCDYVDNNCDGEVDEGCEEGDAPIAPAECGCASGGSADLAPWVLGLGLLAARRRRRGVA
jgi:MYXO-CTERM domain-containing protein